MIGPISNRGGIGRSMTRSETVEALNPLMRTHTEVMHAYLYSTNRTSNSELGTGLEVIAKRTRDDVAKFSEIILSAGGAPYLGTDIEPGSIQTGGEDKDILNSLLERERSYQESLREEIDKNHHIRTLAMLENQLSSSEERVALIKKISLRLRLPVD